MPAVADRHVHIELLGSRGGAAERGDGRPRPRVAARADLPAGRRVGDAVVPRAVDPRGRRDADRTRRLPDEGRAGRPPAPAESSRDPTTPSRRSPTSAGRGATAIKVSLNAEAGPTPSDPELMAICDEAHRLDLPVTAHAQGAGQVERALGAGFDELAHTPWTRLSDDVIESAAARLRIVSTLDIQSYGRDTPEIRAAPSTTSAGSTRPAAR